MLDDLELLTNKVLSSLKEERFSLRAILKDLGKKEQAEFVAYFFERAPHICAEEMILKSPTFFKSWSFEDWHNVVKFSKTDLSHRILCIFFLRYTLVRKDFFERIGVNCQKIFKDYEATVDSLRSPESKRYIKLLFDDYGLSDKDIDIISGLGKV